MTQHIVNVSGGKDSGACLELALMRGKPFRAVMADTGNESQITINHIGAVSERLVQHGLPPVEVVRADFSERIAKKREFVATKWREQGVPEECVRRALDVLQPTGNPFLDLCLWKGRFPSRRAQFCTEFLKQEAIWKQVLEPALQHGPVIQWLGVRRDESPARKNAPRFRVVRTTGIHSLWSYSPIIHWTGQNAIDFTRARGGPINPLYLQGFTRVGCFPCINASKDEIARIAIHHPEVIALKNEWEFLVAEASKRGAATFFPAPTTPEGVRLTRKMKNDAWAQARRVHSDQPDTIINPDDELEEITNPIIQAEEDAIMRKMMRDLPFPKLPDVAEWARSDRGGYQRNFLRDEELEGGLCSSAYGLCE